jgi:hypothetical protein
MEENKEENITGIEQITHDTGNIEAIIEDEETLKKPKPAKKPRTDNQIAAFEKAKVALKVKRENEKAHKLANKKPWGRPRQVKEAPVPTEEPPPDVESNIKYKKKPKQTKYIMSESDSSSEEEEAIVVKKKERRKPKKHKPPKVVYVSQSESDSDSDYEAPLQEPQEPQGPIDHFGGMSR